MPDVHMTPEEFAEIRKRLDGFGITLWSYKSLKAVLDALEEARKDTARLDFVLGCAALFTDDGAEVVMYIDGDVAGRGATDRAAIDAAMERGKG